MKLQINVIVVVLVLGVLSLVSACGKAEITPQTPPEIVYGEDVCDHCGMIISDERFAAAVVIQTASDQYGHRIFDDIGDMLAFVQEAGPQAGDEMMEIVSYFVHDYESGAWLDAHDAHFVQATALRTPMGSGMAAFADHAAAEAQAQAWNAAVLDFDGALSYVALGHTHSHP